MYSLLAISIFLNVVLFFKLRSQHKKMKKEKKGTYEDFYKTQIDSLKKENDKFKEELSQFKKDKFNNTNSGNLVDKVISPIDEPIEDEKPLTVEFQIPKIKENKNNLIYFPSPFEERRFSVEDLSDMEKPNSLYVAEVDVKSNKGNITLMK